MLIPGCINPSLLVARILPVYILPCDLNLTNGGLTVIQRRIDDSVNFTRGWNDYVNGFGDPEGNYWLGLRRVHHISSTCEHGANLFIYLESFTPDDTAYAYYSRFGLSDANSNYRIAIDGYSGTAGGTGFADGASFTTRDNDNDQDINNCADLYRGGWWYVDCHLANLNGLYYYTNPTSYADGICWSAYKGYYKSMRKVEMKIRCSI